jgi:hypothetical protein
MRPPARDQRPEPELVEPTFFNRTELSHLADPRTFFQVAYGRSFLGIPGREELEYLLHTLTSTERQVIIRYYALHGGRPRSLAEIAQASASNVYSIGRIWSEALTKIQQLAQSHPTPADVPVAAAKHESKRASCKLPEYVEELPFSEDTRRRLRNAGIALTEELLSLTPIEMLAHQGIGSTTLNEINRVLSGEKPA